MDVKSAMQELGVQSMSGAGSGKAGADDEGFSVPMYHRKKQARKLQALLTSSKPMTQEGAEHVRNLWSQYLKVEDRIRLYLFWLRKYQVNCFVESCSYIYQVKWIAEKCKCQVKSDAESRK